MVAINGEVVKGSERGAYYVRAYKDKFEENLNLRVFEGTLNVKLNEEGVSSIGRGSGIKIKGFEADGEIFGGVFCVPAKVKDINCWVVLPEKTHHKDVVEIISEFNLRERLGLKDGDKVRIEFSS